MIRTLAIVSLVALCTLARACRNAPGTPSHPGADDTPVAIDLRDLDRTVDPGADFYRFANGGWLQRNPLPADQSSWGTFAVLRERNAVQLRAILDECARTSAPAGSPRQLLGDFWRAAMDTAAIERAGPTPLRPYLAAIEAIVDVRSLARVVGELHRSAAPQALFLFYLDVAVDAPQTAIAAFKQGGLMLPGREHYLASDAEAVALRDRYRRHVATMLRLLGHDVSTAAAEADAVLRVETALATHFITAVQERDANATFHRLTIGDLTQRAPDFAWADYCAALGLDARRSINVVTPDYFVGLGGLMRTMPLADWRAYLVWNLLATNASLLGEAFVAENFAFFEQDLVGTSARPPRWRSVLTQVENNLGWALAQEYVARHFHPGAKAAALAMVAAIRATFRARLADNDWMSAATREQAIAKLDAIAVNIGYPDAWPDLQGLLITPDSHFANVVAASRRQVVRDLQRLDTRVDRAEFGMTPQQVNAYYSARENKIVFPAGILQPPFFDDSFDLAVNLGGIGAVIAHEFTHAFDDEGAHFDGEGRLRDWWTAADRANFGHRRDALITQYAAYRALPDLPLDGTLTVGENIADLGGVSVAFATLQRLQRTGETTPAIDGFTAEQRFFLAWARLWRVHKTEAALRLQIATSTTSYAPFRVRGPLSNLPEFARAFGLADGAAMVRQGSDRVRIW